MPHAERNKSHELEVCGSKVKITISKNRTVHSQIGNSGSSINIHLVGIYFCAKFG
jgi:hypothetical protein